jgi:hypothetical protein
MLSARWVSIEHLAIMARKSVHARHDLVFLDDHDQLFGVRA